MKLTQKLFIAYCRTKLRVLSVLSKRKAAKSAFDLFCTPMRRSKRKTPAVFEKGESVGFSMDDYFISGHRWPSPGARKVLIVHGFESSSKNFDRYITLIVGKGYEVAVFDAPAHGASSGSRINLPLYLKMLQTAYKLYGPFDGFIAHSFGGLAVAHLLEGVPHDECTRLVLIAPATETVTTIDLFFSFLRIPSAVRPAFDELIGRISGFSPGHFSVKRAMQNIRANVLWFHDEEDELTPVSDALAVQEQRYPNVLFRITRGLGHRRIYRDNEVLKEIVDFV